jgi:RNA polymerase sigma-70 factor (ECF subfamily)
MIATLMVAHVPPMKEQPGEAFARATVELRPVVRAVIAAMLNESREHPDVEDCTHEALRRALEGRERLREGEPLRPWVTGIARHVALDALRARRRDRQRLQREAADDECDAPAVLDRVPDSSPSPFDRVSTAQRDAEVRRALEALPKGPREAIRLFHMEGLGYQEIACRLEVPLGTVATWVTRARKALATAVQSAASANQGGVREP